jgi:hypothetical protein
MAESVANNKLRETWDRLVLLLISQPREGWESEFEEITRREVERLAVPTSASCWQGKRRLPQAAQMTPKGDLVTAPRPFYTMTAECLLVAFNLRYPGAEERLRREEAAWCGSARVERLTANCAVLLVRPGGAARLAS